MDYKEDEMQTLKKGPILYFHFSRKIKNIHYLPPRLKTSRKLRKKEKLHSYLLENSPFYLPARLVRSIFINQNPMKYYIHQ